MTAARYASQSVVEKRKVEVEVTLVDGTVHRGTFFLDHFQRTIDVLNDPRAFVPFEDGEAGEVVLLNKLEIRKVRPHNDLKRRPKEAEGVGYKVEF